MLHRNWPTVLSAFGLGGALVGLRPKVLPALVYRSWRRQPKEVEMVAILTLATLTAVLVIEIELILRA